LEGREEEENELKGFTIWRGEMRKNELEGEGDIVSPLTFFCFFFIYLLSSCHLMPHVIITM
jgi:hypothetical protein